MRQFHLTFPLPHNFQSLIGESEIVQSGIGESSAGAIKRLSPVAHALPLPWSLAETAPAINVTDSAIPRLAKKDRNLPNCDQPVLGPLVLRFPTRLRLPLSICSRSIAARWRRGLCLAVAPWRRPKAAPVVPMRNPSGGRLRPMCRVAIRRFTTRPPDCSANWPAAAARASAHAVKPSHVSIAAIWGTLRNHGDLPDCSVFKFSTGT